MFDKSKLPDPLDYFQGRGQKIFSKNAKQFRTTCALHGGDGDTLSAVSYTHLTLPTSDLV